MREWLAKRDRWEKALLAALALYIISWPLESLSTALYVLRLLLQVALYVVGAVVLLRGLARLGTLLLRRFLWRVRRRLAAVFLFVGVIPLALALLLAALGAVLLFAPLAAYIVTTRIEQGAAALHATADSLAWQLRAAEPEARPAVATEAMTEVRRRYPGLMARFETPAGPLSTSLELRRDPPPRTLGNYRGLVRWRQRLYLAAYAEFSPGTPSLLLMAPLTQEFLNSLAAGLGVVQTAAPAAAFGAGEARLLSAPYGEPAGSRATPEPPPLQALLPPPAHPFDWPIAWPAQASVLSWESGTVGREDALVLLTRPSAVLQTILSQQSPGQNRITRYLVEAVLILFGVTLFISAVVAVALTRAITRAVHELHVGTLHVDRGDFSYRVPLEGHDQLADLAQSFNSMTGSIERLIVDSRERHRLESELVIAQEVQQQLFPAQPPQLETLEALGVCRPARVVSGDFFDYVSLGAHRAAFVLGDVSGKGISAALVMASAHSAIRAQLAQLGASDDDPAAAAARLVSEVNRQLHAATSPEKFATLFLAIYDERYGRLSYANAGHLPPMVLRDGRLTRLEVTGMIVGAFPNAAYEGRVIELERGDLLAAFTDGVTEPENPYGQEFGEERLADLLARDRDRPLKELAAAVLEEVDGWTGSPELPDDRTLLLLRRV